GEGWRIARTTLTNERFAVAGGRQGATSVVAPLLQLVASLGGTSDPMLRQELARLYTLDFVLRELQSRARMAREAGLPAGPEGSVAKLVNVQLQKGAAAARARLIGARAIAREAGDTL